MTEFDYVVVGGGTAGYIVAAHDPLAVPDPDLRVRGLPGLRVAGASVFPTIPSVNPVVTVMLTAERATDLIRHSHHSSTSAPVS